MHHRNIVRAIMNYKINIVIKVLILSDLLVFTASNLFAPVFAIYIVDQIQGAGIAEAGIAAAVFMIFKSLFEIPVGIKIDKTKSEKDDLYSALLGTLLTALVYVMYAHIDQVWQLYGLQALLGVGAAIAYPGWYKIFTRHIDKDKEGVEWSLYDVVTGFGMALSAALGGLIAEKFGFANLYYLVALITLAGSLSLFIIRKKVFIK
jgi:MFS family permease